MPKAKNPPEGNAEGNLPPPLPAVESGPMTDATIFRAITFDCYGTLIDWDGGAGAARGPVAPRGAGAQNIENSVENPPIVHTLRATSARGKKRLDHRPFVVRQIKSHDQTPFQGP